MSSTGAKTEAPNRFTALPHRIATPLEAKFARPNTVLRRGPSPELADLGVERFTLAPRRHAAHWAARRRRGNMVMRDLKK